MTVEYRQLADCNPRKGDVFENEYGRFCKAVSDTHAVMDHWPCSRTPKPFEWFAADYRLVSRASDTERDSKPADVRGDECHTPLADMGFSTVEATVSGIYKEPATPKTWGEMTLYGGVSGISPMAYRVRPEPKRETVTLHWRNGNPAYLVEFGDTHRITFDVIDGKPDCASIRMEEL